MKQTIYQYVNSHLDEHGRFTATNLCDDRYATIPRPLGSEDAFHYTMGNLPNPKSASILLKLLQAYLNEPTTQQRSKLYNELKGMAFAEYCDPFIEALDQNDINSVAFDLARRFFYNADGREQVKFALLLFGMYGMEKICQQEPKLWQDLLRIAHCEEFTFAFLYSCRVTNFNPQNAIWELIRCTSGWGKVFSITDCHCRDEEERLWLLQNGPDIDVEYPPLSVKFIKETHLEEQLAHPLNYAQYKSAVIIVGNYLIMLNHFPAEVIEEQFNISDIHLNKLLTCLLEQAEAYVSKPEDVLDLISYVTALQQLCDEQNHMQLTLNQCHEQIAACEKIIYRKDWQPEIENNLIKDDKLDYQLCNLAVELDIDIWPRLFDFWLAHPDETPLFPYLLSYEGEQRSERVLRQIEADLPRYCVEQNDLLVPLRYLNTHPGESDAIICAALESIFDLPRGIACGIVDDWGQEFITPAIRRSLIKARQLSNNDVVTARIDCLLAGKHFDIGKFLNKRK